MIEHFLETKARVFTKVVVWRILLSVSHFLNALIVTGSWQKGLQIVGVTAIVSTIAYWLHEQVWSSGRWGRNKNTRITFTDNFSRTGMKLFTWRIVITITNFLIVYFISGSVRAGVEFMSIATAINIVLYWFHERMWNKIKWGKLINNDV
jgi:uncharacterized membrane protein